MKLKAPSGARESQLPFMKPSSNSQSMTCTETINPLLVARAIATKTNWTMNNYRLQLGPEVLVKVYSTFIDRKERSVLHPSALILNIIFAFVRLTDIGKALSKTGIVTGHFLRATLHTWRVDDSHGKCHHIIVITGIGEERKTNNSVDH